MAEIEFEALRRDVADAEARWVPGPTSMTELLAEERYRRLGVVEDEADLSRIGRQPSPNVSQLIAEQLLGPRVEERSQLLEEMGRLVVETSVLHPQALRLVQRLRYFPWPFFRVDWRNRFGLNAVTAVRDQGGCGSCVAFGSIATMESMLIIERDLILDLSETELLFCGGGSCGGWWPTSAVTYLTNQGVSHESCFPYVPHNVPCNPCNRRDNEALKVTATVTLIDNDPQHDLAQRKDYLFWIGPMIAVFRVFDDFFAYRTGVYSHVSGDFAGLHCVQVIGYDDIEGAWICKNSWGSGWGDNGFFRIAYGQCAIDGPPGMGYPFWGISGTEFWR